MDSPTRVSATELAAAIRRSEISSVEVVDAHIARIEEVEPSLNAMAIACFDEARAAATAADAATARDDRLGPLHGVPITIKEQYRVVGTQTTLGASRHIGNVAADEGPLITALRAAGAVVLGTTNIMQTLAGWECDNPVYGRTNNPWDLDRSPGGSSGGEGALIAAGGSPLGLGGDLGGSIRVPAHFCGIHGLKPTSGRLTNADFAAGLLGTGQEIYVPQPGPMARSVADLCVAMEVLAATSLGSTPDLAAPVPWPDPSRIDVADLRIGAYTDNGLFACAPSIRRAVEDAADALRGLGATVEPIRPPDAEEGMRIFLGAASADGAADLRDLLGDEDPVAPIAALLRGARLPAPARPLLAALMERRGQHHLARVLRMVGTRSAARYQDLTEARSDFRAVFGATMDAGAFDAVICPPVAVTAFTHGSSEHLLAAVSHAFAYNVLGVPAGVAATTTVRPGEESDRLVGRDETDRVARQVDQGSAGLPVGVQIVARHWREDVVLAAMAALEDEARQRGDLPDRTDWRPA